MDNLERTARNAARGRRNRAAGQHFEQLIEAACEWYRFKKRAEIEKTPEPFRVERSVGQGKFVGHYEKKAQPDFKGTLAGGRAIAFEAKQTSTGKLEQKVVLEQQAEALDRHMRLGATCFILISFDFRLFYRVPWEVFRNMKEKYGRKYLTPEDIPEYQIRSHDGPLDFLSEGE
jgi:recombination protein U